MFAPGRRKPQASRLCSPNHMRPLHAVHRILQSHTPMKHALAALLIIAASLHAAEPKDDFPNFMALKKDEAAKVARKQAEADFTAGRYRILSFGLTGAMKDERLAKAGIEKKPIAGCIVSDGILEGARVYNEVMREKLKAKLGRDVFDDKNDTTKGKQK
jgi:hypothetical protein